MKLNKMLGIFLVLVLFAVLSFFMISYQNSTPHNLSPQANETFNNQTKAMDVTYVGLNAVLYILIAAMVIVAGMFLYYTVMRRH